MRKDIHHTLARMGLKAAEQRVFLVCLANREGLFAQEIAAQTKIKRSTVDLVIARMIEQNFLSKQKIGQRFCYTAQSPESIAFKKEQTLDDFKNLIPFLNRLNSSAFETDARFFEGLDGVRQMYREGMLRLRTADMDKRRILAITSGNDLVKTIPDFENFWIKRRIQMKIPVRMLVPKTSLSVATMTNDPSKYRTVKYFDDKAFPYRIGIEIFADDMVGIFSVAKPVRGFVLRDPLMAQSFTCLFEAMWQLLPEAD